MNAQPNIHIVDFMPQSKRFVPPSIDEVFGYGAQFAMPLRECEKFHSYFESVGWVVGRSRKKMVSWKGALRTWRLNWQDKQETSSAPSLSVQIIQQQNQLKRVESRLEAIKNQYPLKKDSPLIVEQARLRAVRQELINKLGFSV